MKEFLENPIIVGTLIIIIILLLGSLNMFFSAYRKTKKVNKNYKYENIFYQYMDELNNEMAILFDARTLYPYYISKSFLCLGLELESIENDFTCLAQFIDEQQLRQLKRELQQWNQNKPFSFHLCYKHEDNTCYGHLFIELTKDKRYYLAHLQDETFEMENKLELKKELESAMNQIQNKSEFLSQMSHEIRTPMNGIIGMIDLATKEEISAKGLEYLNQAGNLSHYLLGLINDILDMSRLENNKVELAHEVFSIQIFITKIDTLFRKNIESKGIEFKVEVDGFEEQYLIGDELRLSQVVTNFLSNAQKFTERGYIELTVKQMQKTSHEIAFMIRVRDTGKGMKKDFLQRIFKPFEQENATIAKNYGGSGLGLAIADSMIKLMNGQIVVDSELGKGSDFTVYLTLPYQDKDKVEIKEKSSIKKIVLQGMRVILAEDNDINALIVTRLLKHHGVAVIRAKDGLEAIELVKKSHENEIDFILMDINMPNMDGYEATNEIRKLPRKDAQTMPIIGCSADAFEEQKRYSLSIGMNGHIAKPVDLDKLRDLLSVL